MCFRLEKKKMLMLLLKDKQKGLAQKQEDGFEGTSDYHGVSVDPQKFSVELLFTGYSGLTSSVSFLFLCFAVKRGELFQLFCAPIFILLYDVSCIP